MKQTKVASENFLHDEAFEKRALQMCKQFYRKRSGNENDINFRYITSGRESEKGSAVSWPVNSSMTGFWFDDLLGTLWKQFINVVLKKILNRMSLLWKYFMIQELRILLRLAFKFIFWSSLAERTVQSEFEARKSLLWLIASYLNKEFVIQFMNGFTKKLFLNNFCPVMSTIEIPTFQNHKND